MSDETEMNSELEQLAAQLRNVQVPEANIDRDQLMYDAGWAAAMTQGQTQVTSRARPGAVAVSFVSGLAVAACAILSFSPFIAGEETESGITQNSVSVALTESSASNEIGALAQESFRSDSSSANVADADLIDWINSVPQGHSFAAGFSSRPVSPNVVPASYSSGRSVNPLTANPTSRTLLRQFVPTAPAKKVVPEWTKWLIPGA